MRDLTLPPELKNKKFDFFSQHFDGPIDLNHPPQTLSGYSKNNCAWEPSRQTFQADASLTFWVFLDNGDIDRIHHKVLFILNMRVSPGEIIGDPKPIHYKCSPGSDQPFNGLYQGAIEIEITPKLPVEQINWAKSSPKTVNQEHQKTESTSNTISFSVGYQTASGSASYTYEEGDSFTIADWNVVETGAGNRMSWKSWQQLPWNAMEGGENADRSKVPDLSNATMQFLGQGLWVTRDKLNEPVEFDMKLYHLPQGIFVLPKVAMPTQFRLHYSKSYTVDFRKVQ